MSAAITKLTEEVAEAKTVGASARALITGLAERLRVVAGNESATLALANELDSSNADLASAVTENTPSEGTEPPAEPPVV